MMIMIMTHCSCLGARTGQETWSLWLAPRPRGWPASRCWGRWAWPPQPRPQSRPRSWWTPASCWPRRQYWPPPPQPPGQDNNEALMRSEDFLLILPEDSEWHSTCTGPPPDPPRVRVCCKCKYSLCLDINKSLVIVIVLADRTLPEPLLAVQLEVWL